MTGACRRRFDAWRTRNFQSKTESKHSAVIAHPSYRRCAFSCLPPLLHFLLKRRKHRQVNNLEVGSLNFHSSWNRCIFQIARVTDGQRL